jgi:hypothetical protein
MSDNKIIDLNEIFNDYFFKKFTFILDNKVLKEGRLKLFTMKGFNLKFFLIDSENTIKNLEIPYPFSLVKNDNGYIFDYRLEKFKLIENTELINNLADTDCQKSRYYDKPLIIKIE